MISLSAWRDLMAADEPVSKKSLKDAVFDDFKFKRSELRSISGVEVNFEPADGSDILISVVDPEKALGQQVFGNQQDYFDSLDTELGVGGLMGGGNG